MRCIERADVYIYFGIGNAVNELGSREVRLTSLHGVIYRFNKLYC